MAARRKLKLWEALGLSLGLTGPTLAMAGNGQGVIGEAGKAVPLVFLLGFLGVAVVAYGFIRLTRRFNHAGSAYALVGSTLGPRAGFVAGFCLLGTYLFFTVSTSVIFAIFLEALLSAAGMGFSAGYGVWAMLCLIVCGYGNTRENRAVSRVLLVIEGVGIVAMLVLVAAILWRGGADTTGLDLSTFTAGGVGVDSVMAAVVLAFLSWAGFEACAALGEETDQPRRNIPRALMGTVALTGALYVVVMFAQTVGFGTDPQGLAAFQGSGNTLGELGERYVAHWFALVLLVTAVLAAFASNLSSVMTCGRLVMALARDGFGPRVLATNDPRHHVPRNAVLATAGIGGVVMVSSWLTGWPVMGNGDPAMDAYYFYAVVGTTCLLVAYLLVGVAVFAARWRKQIDLPAAGLLVPGLGCLFIAGVVYYTVKDSSGFAPAYVAFGWVVGGVLVALLARNLTVKIGQSLTKELDETPPPWDEPANAG